MIDKPIYLVQVPNTFSPQQIAEIWETIEKKVKDKTVIVSEYEGTEIKHTVLGDSFNKELYEAKMFKDAVFRMIRDTDVATSCILVGGNVKLSDTYGFDVDSPENAIMDIIVRYYKQIIVIEELEHKIKMLSL
jgi:hypothetical protein